jgi:cytochrome c biogenesis factor
MQTFSLRTGLGFGLALAIFAFGVTGCASHRQSQERTEAATAGAAMQQGGIMSQSSYIRIRELGHDVSRTHTISEADLDWTLTELSAEKNSIARARAFTILSEIRPMSAAQQAKILPIITPYLSSTDKLDQLGAQRVQKAVRASG